MWEIQFTDNGKRVATWKGYSSYGEATRAIRDADLIIPFSWEYEIEESGK